MKQGGRSVLDPNRCAARRFAYTALACVSMALGRSAGGQCEQQVVVIDAKISSNIGWDVALDGDTAIVGQTSFHPPIIYQRDADGNWCEVIQLSSAPAWSVSISGDTVIAGSPFTETVHVHDRNHGGED